MPTTPPPPATPLVLRFGAFGDMILMIPLLKLLRQRFGAPCDVVSSGPWTEPVLQRVPAVAERFYLTSRRAPYWFNRSQQQLVRWLRARPAGPVYVFEPDEKPLELLRRAGIPRDRICTLRDFPRHPGEHILAHFARLARATPAAFDAFASTSTLPLPDIRPLLSDADHHDCAAWLATHRIDSSPLVLVQPGNKKTMKGGDRRRPSNVDYWPEDRWARVIEGVLSTLPSARVILCGTPSERPLAEEIVSHLSSRDRVLIATDELPIPRLFALQARAHSQISVNTGPAHAAAAMGCPLVVLFTRHAHRAADLYAPVPTTAPVTVIQPAVDQPDLTLATITPDDILAAWRALQPANAHS
jgi:ADP-heptose:LPS heptosyltransferase